MGKLDGTKVARFGPRARPDGLVPGPLRKERCPFHLTTLAPSGVRSEVQAAGTFTGKASLAAPGLR